MGKRKWFVCIFLAIFGLMPLFNFLRNPRAAGLHGADVVQILAAGFCFGVAFGILIGSRRFPDEKL